VIKVLGPVELSGDHGGRLSPRQRSVVAALALGGGAAVDTDALLRRVWGAAPPPSARKALQVHVLAVRNVLGAAHVATTPHGYRLVAGSDEVDAWHFERVVRAALRDPAPGRELADALALWRGTPFDDVQGDAAGPARARLEELARTAVDRWAELLVDRGAADEAAELLEAALLDDPRCERRWSLLVVALQRAGRPEAGQRAYERAVTALTQVGLDPGPLLRKVKPDVLDQVA
jgi:DNA-binding SARP family transcriptional activator